MLFSAIKLTSTLKHFTDDGIPLRPSCYRDAATCQSVRSMSAIPTIDFPPRISYIHPQEEKWAIAKNDYRPSFRPRGSKSGLLAGRMRSPSMEDNMRRHGRRASPLVAQSELFVRNVRESPDTDREAPAGKDVAQYRRPSNIADSLSSSAAKATASGFTAVCILS